MNAATFSVSARPVRVAMACATLLMVLSGTTVRAAAQSDPELAAIRSRLEKANQQTAQVLAELKSLDAQIFQVARRVEREQAEIDALHIRIRSSQRESDGLHSRLDELKTQQNERARRIYKDGPATVFAALFAVRALADLPKLSIFWRSLFEKDAHLESDLSETLDRLQSQKATLAESSAAAAQRSADLQEMKATLKSTRNRRSSALGGLRKSIIEAMAAEKALLAARAAAEAARAAAEKRAAAAVHVRPSPGPCVPGSPAKDRRLAALLEWYAPAVGAEPYMPPRLGPTGVVFNGVTSWYGPGFEGCATSSGATFRSHQMTAASLSLPLGTLLKVTGGAKSVVVVITDRGPYIQGRDLDLSRAAAAAIGATGVSTVRMEVVLPQEPAPPFP